MTARQPRSLVKAALKGPCNQTVGMPENSQEKEAGYVTVESGLCLGEKDRHPHKNAWTLFSSARCVADEKTTLSSPCP